MNPKTYHQILSTIEELFKPIQPKTLEEFLPLAGYHKAALAGIQAELLNHPEFPALRKKYERNSRPLEDYQICLCLTADLGEKQKPLQRKLLEHLGIKTATSPKSIFKTIHLSTEDLFHRYQILQKEVCEPHSPKTNQTNPKTQPSLSL